MRKNLTTERKDVSVRRAFVLLCVLLLALAPGLALGSPGGATDGPDSGGQLDIDSVAHSDSGSTITYTLTFVNTPQASEIDEATWHIDFNGDGTEDGCVSVFANDSGGLSGDVFGGGSCGGGGGAVGSAQATLSGKVLTVTVAQSALCAAGTFSGSYRYSVETIDFPAGGTGSIVSDDAPNRNGSTLNMSIQHTGLGACSGTNPPPPPPVVPPPPVAPPPVVPPPVTPGNNTSSQGQISDNTVTRGQKVVVSGSGFKANVLLTGTFNSSQAISLGTTTSDGVGGFSVTVTIPASATPGAHRINFVGANNIGGLHTSFVDLTVIAGAPNGGDNPMSGHSLPADAMRAFAVLTTGGLAFAVVTFRRRRAPA